MKNLNAVAGDRGNDRKATLHRTVMECLCVCKRARWRLKEEKRNCSNCDTLLPFERFVTGERIIKAVKLGCFNMPAVEEYDWG